MVFLTLGEIEMRGIGRLSRQGLLDALSPRLGCLPPDLAERLEDQPTDRLRLLLLAARLLYTLRQLQARDGAGTPGRGSRAD
jgi:hypothetical protein